MEMKDWREKCMYLFVYKRKNWTEKLRKIYKCCVVCLLSSSNYVCVSVFPFAKVVFV
jgi:hypothetical protein